MFAVFIKNVSSDGSNRKVIFGVDNFDSGDYQVVVPLTATAAEVNAAVLAEAAAEANTTADNMMLFGGAQ